MTPPNNDRYSRQTLAGWRQDVLRNAHVLVVGVGALGNEVLKNLALVGIGAVDLMDFDRVEQSNLSRCVLFRDADLGLRKAAAAAKRLQELSPSTVLRALHEDVRFDVGAGSLRGYDLVLGCVDTIEARLALGRLCRDATITYLDGGMDARGGQVSLFSPTEGACYECGMTASMWARVHDRQSCLRLGTGEDAATAPMAATAIMASSIGALQAQEAVRYLLRDTGSPPQPLRPGEKLSLQTEPYGMFVLTASVSPDCAAHAQTPPSATFAAGDLTVAEVLQHFVADALSPTYDIVTALECTHCGREEVVAPLHRVALQCLTCGSTRLPEMQSSITRNDRLSSSTLAELGIPPRSVLDLVRATERVRVELL